MSPAQASNTSASSSFSPQQQRVTAVRQRPGRWSRRASRTVPQSGPDRTRPSLHNLSTPWKEISPPMRGPAGSPSTARVGACPRSGTDPEPVPEDPASLAHFARLAFPLLRQPRSSRRCPCVRLLGSPGQAHPRLPLASAPLRRTARDQNAYKVGPLASPSRRPPQGPSYLPKEEVLAALRLFRLEQGGVCVLDCVDGELETSELGDRVCEARSDKAT